MVVGLGFVLSFGYWCTDFLVVQRAMAASSMNAARRTPLIAAVPKMLFPALVILPGMIAIALHTSSGGHFLPIGADGKPDYDLTIPTMLGEYFPTGLLGIGFTALMASFMSGMAGNVTAFNTVWTYDIYQSYIAPDKSDDHYLWMGRVATVAGILLSIGAAVLRLEVQQHHGRAPTGVRLRQRAALRDVPARHVLEAGDRPRGVLGAGERDARRAASCTASPSRRATRRAIKGGWIAPRVTFPSEMGQNFRMAIVAWTFCFVVTIVVSLLTARTQDRRRTHRPGLLADAQAEVRGRAVVHATGGASA